MGSEGEGVVVGNGFHENSSFYLANLGPMLSLVLQGVQIVMITPLNVAQAHGNELKDSALRTSRDLKNRATCMLDGWKSGAGAEPKGALTFKR